MDLTESELTSKTFMKCKVTPGTYSLYKGLFIAPNIHNVALQLHNVAQHNIAIQLKIAIHHKQCKTKLQIYILIIIW